MVAADLFLMDRYDELGLELVGSDAHAASAYDAAAQGIILLKNDRKHLPLSLEQGLTVAVIGPHANSSTGHDSPGLLGAYNNEDNVAVLNQTMLLAARRHFGAQHVLYSPGCDSLGCPNRSAFAAATAAAKQADVAVVFLGISGGFEAETKDRNACSERPGSSSWTPPAFCPGPNPAWKHGESVGLALPGNQTALALAVAEANPKTIVVLVHGGMVYLEEIVQTGASVVSALYPGQQGGDAVWDVLTGARPPAGKLPYTWCKRSPLFASSSEVEASSKSSAQIPTSSRRSAARSTIRTCAPGSASLTDTTPASRSTDTATASPTRSSRTRGASPRPAA